MKKGDVFYTVDDGVVSERVALDTDGVVVSYWDGSRLRFSPVYYVHLDRCEAAKVAIERLTQWEAKEREDAAKATKTADKCADEIDALRKSLENR